MQPSPEARHRFAVRTERRPGDVGCIVYLHGTLYEQEHGLDATFDGYVAEGLAQFVLSFDPGKDRLWLAELDGRIVGSVAIVGRAENAAQLRWFLVHPDCREQGLGRTLLDEALRFCHECGFRPVYLWTFSELTAAAHLYRDAGFRRTELKTHRIWGRIITEERYDLML